jgi:hypothetical protein
MAAGGETPVTRGEEPSSTSNSATCFWSSDPMPSDLDPTAWHAVGLVNLAPPLNSLWLHSLTGRAHRSGFYFFSLMPLQRGRWAGPAFFSQISKVRPNPVFFRESCKLSFESATCKFNRKRSRNPFDLIQNSMDSLLKYLSNGIGPMHIRTM